MVKATFYFTFRLDGFVRHLIRLPAILALTFTSIVALGSDASSGKYYAGGGVGAVECPKFVDSMNRAKQYGKTSADGWTLGYAKEVNAYVSYIFGFQTAYNLQTPNTYSIFGGHSTDQLLEWIENYCRSNPLEQFGSAVVALAAELYPRRIRTYKED